MPLEVDLENKYLDEIYVAAQYDGVIKKLITTFKYKSVIAIGEILAELLWHCVAFPQADYVTFVPISKKKLQQRGFNQAERICKKLSELSRIPYQSSVIKTVETKPQAGTTSKSERLENVRNSFVIDPQFLISIRNNVSKPLTMLVIDDVTTTGTTLNEVAKVLKENGIEKVYGLTIAHGY
jgi:competence protein ComFC